MIDPKFFEKTLFLNGYIIFTLLPKCIRNTTTPKGLNFRAFGMKTSYHFDLRRNLGALPFSGYFDNNNRDYIIDKD